MKKCVKCREPIEQKVQVEEWSEARGNAQPQVIADEWWHTNCLIKLLCMEIHLCNYMLLCIGLVFYHFVVKLIAGLVCDMMIINMSTTYS